MRDLGSRNGTMVDGDPLQAGIELELGGGSRVCFDHADQTWQLLDDTAPGALLIPEDEAGSALIVVSGVTALPTPHQPWATVFSLQDDCWRLETEDGVVPLRSGQTFEVRGRRWRFSCPRVLPRTSTSDWSELAGREDPIGGLSFRVSADEEHVQLWLERSGDRVDLGSRAHNYLLLCLARSRLSDAELGLGADAAGWVYRDELPTALRIDRENLNLMIFRIRKQFEVAGISDPARVIERRPDSHQLRIGVARLAVSRV